MSGLKGVGVAEGGGGGGTVERGVQGRKEGAAEGGGERHTSGEESERSRKGDREAGFSKKPLTACP